MKGCLLTRARSGPFSYGIDMENELNALEKEVVQRIIYVDGTPLADRDRLLDDFYGTTFERGTILESNARAAWDAGNFDFSWREYQDAAYLFRRVRSPSPKAFVASQNRDRCGRRGDIARYRNEIALRLSHCKISEVEANSPRFVPHCYRGSKTNCSRKGRLDYLREQIDKLGGLELQPFVVS
jgi:hypothetical protein